MRIVYCDDKIAVVVEPVGIISTEVRGGLPFLLRRQLGCDCILTVHRLDAQVSGLMVLARTAEAASELSRQIREQTFHKEYLAVVHGEPPQSGTLRDLLGRDKERRITYVAQEPGKGVQEAILHYKVLDRCKGNSLVSIVLETGRTHQIRVQFASRGLPILGDGRYGSRDRRCEVALFSHALGFRHPVTGKTLRFSDEPEGWPWSLFSVPALMQKNE